MGYNDITIVTLELFLYNSGIIILKGEHYLITKNKTGFAPANSDVCKKMEN
jgi:hypothetical protein